MSSTPLEKRYYEPPDHRSKYQRLQLVKQDPGTMPMICQRIAEGESLKHIADSEMVPYGLLQLWITDDAKRMELYRNAEKIRADGLIHEAIERSDDAIHRDPDGFPVLNEAGQPVEKSVNWARLQVQTRLKAAQLFDPERFVQAVKPEAPQLSDSGIAEVAKRLASAFDKRNLPSSQPHIPQDIEAINETDA